MHNQHSQHLHFTLIIKCTLSLSSTCLSNNNTNKFFAKFRSALCQTQDFQLGMLY